MKTLPKNYRLLGESNSVILKGDYVRYMDGKWELANGWIGCPVSDAQLANLSVARKIREPHTPRQPIYREALNAMIEASQLFPNQDPIRLTAGLLDFKMPLPRTMSILRRLAPHFKGANADMIRLAAGYNDLSQAIRASRAAMVAKALKATV